MHSPNFALLAPFTLLLLNAAAQKVQSCDFDLCPSGQILDTVCPLGDFDASNIGIANLSTPLSLAPFTWTEAYSDSSEETVDAFNFSRNYYLGFPTEVRLNKTDDVAGCALFFHGLSQKLKFSDPATFESTGTCQDAMGAACVTDLLSQAQKMIAENEVVNTTVCLALQEMLNGNGPQSCNITQSGGFGLMTAKDITGDSLPDPVELSTCHPTNRGNYSLILIDHNELIGDATNKEAAWGVTPILTAFVPKTPLAEKSDGKGSGLSLTCVKPVIRKPEASGSVNQGTGLNPGWGLATFAAVFVMAILGGYGL